MIGFLASRFIKDYQNTSDAAVRRAYGVLCGAVGIVINLLLFALKLFAGTLAGSVAVTADAFNNLSDAGASIVTLLGFRLAGQKPDPEHPFGHGRLEYISGLIVSIVILLMGFELLRDAVGAILHPEAVECSVLTVAILLVSICAKFYMYCYNRGVGKKISAAAMQATAADSLSDCAATAGCCLRHSRAISCIGRSTAGAAWSCRCSSCGRACRRQGTPSRRCSASRHRRSSCRRSAIL